MIGHQGVAWHMIYLTSLALLAMHVENDVFIASIFKVKYFLSPGWIPSLSSSVATRQRNIPISRSKPAFTSYTDDWNIIKHPEIKTQWTFQIANSACLSFVQYQQLLSLFLELIKPCQNCLFLLLSFGQPANWNVDTFGVMKTMNILNYIFA